MQNLRRQAGFNNHGHQRIIAWLQSQQRHPGKSCTTKGTRKKKERKALASARTQQKSKKRTRRVFTFSSSRHRAKTFCYGLLSLRMLFVSISQSLFLFSLP
jgi:hypothetical protein